MKSILNIEQKEITWEKEKDAGCCIRIDSLGSHQFLLLFLMFCSCFLCWGKKEGKNIFLKHLSCQENNEVTFDHIFAVFLAVETFYKPSLSALMISPFYPFLWWSIVNLYACFFGLIGVSEPRKVISWKSCQGSCEYQLEIDTVWAAVRA